MYGLVILFTMNVVGTCVPPQPFRFLVLPFPVLPRPIQGSLAAFVRLAIIPLIRIDSTSAPRSRIINSIVDATTFIYTLLHDIIVYRVATLARYRLSRPNVITDNQFVQHGTKSNQCLLRLITSLSWRARAKSHPQHTRMLCRLLLQFPREASFHPLAPPVASRLFTLPPPARQSRPLLRSQPKLLNCPNQLQVLAPRFQASPT